MMRAIFAAALSALALCAASPKVDALAKEGHWVPNAWAAHSQMLGKPAPSLELSDWSLGSVTPAQMKGKIVVVDFWATWCGPCRRAIPHNNELLKQFGGRGVVLFGACGGGQEEKMAEVAKKEGGAYPTAKASQACTKAWKIQFWPTYAIIDRKGDVRALGVKPDYVEKILEALLEEQPA